MAKVMWLGEDELHKSVTPDGRTVESAGPSFTTWGGVKFVKGEAVEIDKPGMIAKAKINQFFVVDDDVLPLPNSTDLTDGHVLFTEAETVKVNANKDKG